MCIRDRRKKAEEEKGWQKEYARRKKFAQKRVNPPFFNSGTIPPVTGLLVSIFVLIHIALFLFTDEMEWMGIMTMFGFVPGYFTGAAEWSWNALVGAVSYAFLHGGWMHVAVNAFMTLAFGTFVERQIGGRGFLLFFFFCSIGGAAVTVLLNPFSLAPVIGASGGTSGLFAAMMIAMYDRGMMGPMMQNLARYGVWPFLGFWLGMMVLMGLILGGIAWQAHVGGYLVGIMLVLLMKRGLISL